MTVNADWQGFIVERSFLFGANTAYSIQRPPGVVGVTGLADQRVDDPPRGLLDGNLPGRTTYGERLISLRLRVSKLAVADLGVPVRALKVGWRRPDPFTEYSLDLQTPGSPETVMRYYGRPHALADAPEDWTLGTLAFDADWVCQDPFAYGATVASGTQSSTPYSVPAINLGDLGADTDRVTLTVNGNGGTPVVTNSTSGGTIVFGTTLAGGSAYSVDLRTRIVTLSGVNHDQDVAASTTWWNLLGGQANSIAFSGCASIVISHRPAYL